MTSSVRKVLDILIGLAGQHCLRRRSLAIKFLWCFVLVGWLAPQQVVKAAEELKLKPGISFTQDLDTGFPIAAMNMDDCRISSTSPTLLFFGASGDLNTNRQAKRIVDLYKKLPVHSVKFVLIDVDHPPNDDARSLIKSYYHGYIPAQALFNKQAKLTWNHDGEIELSIIKTQVDKCL